MSEDTTRPRVHFRPRSRNASNGALAVAGPHHLEPTCPVLDIAFQVGSDRILALRVDLPGHGPAVLDAVFATPTRNGTVRVPPLHGRGWSGQTAAHGPVRWLSSVLGAAVLSCAGLPLGPVQRVVVDHFRQRVVDLVLTAGTRMRLDHALVLRDGSLLVDEELCERNPIGQWLAWQQDLETGLFWWDGRLQRPPALEPLRAQAPG